MSTRTVSVQEAEKRLAELIGLAQQGDEIVIASVPDHKFCKKILMLVRSYVEQTIGAFSDWSKSIGCGSFRTTVLFSCVDSSLELETSSIRGSFRAI